MELAQDQEDKRLDWLLKSYHTRYGKELGKDYDTFKTDFVAKGGQKEEIGNYLYDHGGVSKVMPREKYNEIYGLTGEVGGEPVEEGGLSASNLARGVGERTATLAAGMYSLGEFVAQAVRP